MSQLSQRITEPIPGGNSQWLKTLMGSRYVLTLLTLVIFLVIWEIGVKIFDVRSYVLPPPSEIFVALFKYHKQLSAGVAYTLQSLIIGYLAAVVLGVLLALPIAFSDLMQRTVYPIMVLSQLVPKVALAPIFVVWFGFSLLPKVMVVFLLSFFAVVLNGIVGLRSIDPEIIHLTRSTGASRLDTFLKVRLPNSLPTFFAGFKLAAISATVGAVIGEFIGSDSGLGYIILTANGDLQTDLSFAAIISLTFVGLVLYSTVEFVERLSIPWHVSQRGPEEGVQGA